MRQFLLMQDAFLRKQNAEQNKLIESWRQTRMIAFNVIRPYLIDQKMTSYEYMPLPNDPEKNERAIDEAALEVIEYYTKMGWLKKNEA